MSPTRYRRGIAVAAISGTIAVAPLGAAHAAPAPSTSTGPSTSTAPYVIPAAPGVAITSLLTVKDSVNGYSMVGIPDGLGATGAPGGKVTVLMNHELGGGLGATRAHLRKGAFVSKWTLDPATGQVLAGGDLVKAVVDWDYAAGTYEDNTDANSDFNRFCSSSLTEPGQLLDKVTGSGYDGQIYFGNEESGDSARTFGITMDGIAYQLPRIGLFSSETTVAAPTKGKATVVLGNEDGGMGEIRLYVGSKESGGSPVDRAGLTNGTLHVVAVDGAADDAAFRSTYGKGAPAPVTFPEIDWTKSGPAQNLEASAVGISLNRIEDGAFDPRKPNDYYFLTTEGGDQTPVPNGPSRNGGGFWRLSFADVNDPSKGATLTLLLDGSEAPFLNKPDNMTIDNGGNVLIQEDPGGNPHIARIVAYRIADGATGVVAQFDPAQFGATDAPGFITQDEESSGIIDVSSLWKRPNTFLFDAQVHEKSSLAGTEWVEPGQLLTLTVQSWGQVYGGKGAKN